MGVFSSPPEVSDLYLNISKYKVSKYNSRPNLNSSSPPRGGEFEGFSSIFSPTATGFCSIPSRLFPVPPRNGKVLFPLFFPKQYLYIKERICSSFLARLFLHRKEGCRKADLYLLPSAHPRQQSITLHA